MAVVTAVAVVVGLACLLLGIGYVRSPELVDDLRVRLLGAKKRSGPRRDASLGRGLFYLCLGLLCLTFALVGWAG